MKVDTTFLQSRVARRIFLLFILCALVPISALAILSFRQVTAQLHQQSQTRLRQATKGVGVAIYERLLFLEGEMKQIGSDSSSGFIFTPQRESEGPRSKVTQRFNGMILTGSGGERSLSGRVGDPPDFSAGEREYLKAGRTLISSQVHSGLGVRIFMSRGLPQHPGGILVGEINPAYLWDTGDDSTLPPNTELCVLDQDNVVLYCSVENPASIREQVVAAMHHAAIGQFEWEDGKKGYLASYRPVSLPSHFRNRKWIVVLSESRADVLAPMRDFKKIFPLVILLALWVVLLLSVSQIRRSLVPLEKLQEGTTRVAQREFGTRVAVNSGDEFEELANSFNLMASQLGRQFHALSTIAEIDQAILGALDTGKIVETLLARMRDVFRCDGVAVTLLDAKVPSTGRTRFGDGGPRGESLEAVQLSPDEIARLRANPDSLVITDGDLPGYLGPLAAAGISTFLVLPIFLKERLSGIITLGYRTPTVPGRDDLEQARQLANQVAVALSNARLVEELAELNWGTLTALARAIDAKSPWTLGHSERVTDLALRIARVMGFPQRELDTLHRGGLLHDIGKIGTPPEILEKRGRLTPDEAHEMRLHVRIGARILEPIAAYAEAIPIVLQHHEWFDGTGYPEGLAGEKISLGARVFAVADCYDALVSDRPYRPGMEPERVIEIIKQGSGRQFDPNVVQAFLQVMSRGKPDAPGRSEDVRSLVPAGQDS